jgi:hypothetical protein
MIRTQGSIERKICPIERHLPHVKKSLNMSFRQRHALTTKLGSHGRPISETPTERNQHLAARLAWTGQRLWTCPHELIVTLQAKVRTPGRSFDLFSSVELPIQARMTGMAVLVHRKSAHTRPPLSRTSTQPASPLRQSPDTFPLDGPKRAGLEGREDSLVDPRRRSALRPRLTLAQSQEIRKPVPP